MKKTNIKSILSFIVCMVLIAAMALFTIGCDDKSTSSEPADKILDETDIRELGDGKTQLSFTVVDPEGNESHFVIYTNKTILADALLEHDLIKIKDGFVTTVNGITLDYEKDGKYWAFYVDGKYANYGVQDAEISDVSKYYFKAE